MENVKQQNKHAFGRIRFLNFVCVTEEGRKAFLKRNENNIEPKSYGLLLGQHKMIKVAIT